jgi:hypothetical protein
MRKKVKTSASITAPKSRSEFSVVNLNSNRVNLANFNSPVIDEVKGKEWITYGADNNYYQYLIDRYNGSPTNSAIVNAVSQMIYGKGLDATDSNRKPNQYAQMKSLFSNDAVRKLVYDLKLMGQCAIQVIYSKNRSSIAQIEHFPIETLRAEKANEDGDVEAYYYFNNWANMKPSDEPQRIPAFGYSNESIEILYVKPYRAGFYYYSPVDYQGGLQYAELEENISNFHLNNIQNGLAPSMLINFNNGTPDEDQRKRIEKSIIEKYSGSSNSGKFILSFNDNADTAATIETVQLSDAHNQYQFLSDESSRKIMVSHRVVSPMLLGIKDSTGLGNNADEIKTASTLMDNTVIRPFQDLIIDSFNKILAFNEISLSLYFKTLQPLEFTELDNVTDKDTREEETGVKMSSEKPAEVENELADLLIEFGEDEDLENWDLVDERPVDYDQEEALDKMIGLASTGSARPNAKSALDGTTESDNKFIVRYQYAPLAVSNNSREFCKKMVAAKKIYRKEDIEQMSQNAVNAGWGQGGDANYDIFKYKGGGDCHHFWMRKTYMAKDGVKPDINSPKTKPVYKQQREKEGIAAPSSQDEPDLVSVKPKDMTNRGFIKPRG